MWTHFQNQLRNPTQTSHAEHKKQTPNKAQLQPPPAEEKRTKYKINFIQGLKGPWHKEVSPKTRRSRICWHSKISKVKRSPKNRGKNPPKKWDCSKQQPLGNPDTVILDLLSPMDPQRPGCSQKVSYDFEVFSLNVRANFSRSCISWDLMSLIFMQL